MGAVNLAGVAPDVVLPGQAEGQLLVLPVVPAYIDGEAVGGFKAHGRELSLPGPLPACFRAQIALLLEFLPDFLQFGVGLGTVQLVQYAFQVIQLIFSQLQLVGQLLFGVFHPGVILVEFCRVLLGGEDGA